MNQLGLAGTDGVDAVTFVVTLGGFIPSAFGILQVLCVFVGFLTFVNAGFRQVSTSHGRGEHTSAQNFMHACFGAAMALSAELIGSYGKGIFGDFQSASVLLYAAKDQGSLSKVAMASFLSLVQFIGACACVLSLRISDRLATGKPYPGETWTSVFWYGFGGLGCVFIQQTVGLISGLTGMNIARFINSL